MSGYKNIESFYNLYLQLQDIKRTGWVIRNVPAENLETVADHTLQVVVLATTLCHEFKLNFDISKLVQMSFIHDIGEIIIGDVAVIDKNYEEKKQYEDEAVTKLLESLSDETSKWYLSLWHELNERETELAKFVYQIDKIDAVMRAKKYSKDYNMSELFDEFYNHQVEAGTFDESVLKDFFEQLKD